MAASRKDPSAPTGAADTGPEQYGQVRAAPKGLGYRGKYTAVARAGGEPVAASATVPRTVRPAVNWMSAAVDSAPRRAVTRAPAARYGRPSGRACTTCCVVPPLTCNSYRPRRSVTATGPPGSAVTRTPGIA